LHFHTFAVILPAKTRTTPSITTRNTACTSCKSRTRLPTTSTSLNRASLVKKNTASPAGSPYINKCHFSENKWLLFRNKWHLLREQKPRTVFVLSPYGLSGALLPDLRSTAGKCQADSREQSDGQQGRCWRSALGKRIPTANVTVGIIMSLFPFDKAQASLALFSLNHELFALLDVDTLLQSSYLDTIQVVDRSVVVRNDLVVRQRLDTSRIL